jgi:hypothetical protein
VALSWRKTWFSPGESVRCLAREWRRHVEAVSALQAPSGSAWVLEVYYERLVADTAAVLRDICAFIDLPYDAKMLNYHRTAASRLVEHRARVGTDGVVLVTQEQRLRQQALTSCPPCMARIAAWRHEMSHEEIDEFEKEAGTLLDTLGYPRGSC